MILFQRIRCLWQPRTLRVRLAAWYSIASVLLLSCFSATIYFFVAHRLAQPLDRQLRSDLTQINAALSFGPNQEVLWNGRPLSSETADNHPWFELWTAERQLHFRHWGLDQSEVKQLPHAPIPGRETLSIFSINNTRDNRIRALNLPLAIKPDWMLRVIRPHAPAAEALHALLLILTLSLPLVITLLVVGGFLITRHWLRPLDDMVERARLINARDLTARLPVIPEQELGRLSQAFNPTLDRLESSFRALDQFVADASHELKTPLTTLGNVGEIALQSPRTTEEYRDTIASMLEEASRLKSLVERLLQLARADGRSDLLHPQHVLLDSLIAEIAADFQILAEEKNQTISLQLPSIALRTDPFLVQQAVRNLLDNAIKFSPPRTTITLALEKTAGQAVQITVSDEGEGIPEEQRPRLTERFYRADPSRARGPGGQGLGLALVNAYLRALGGHLSYAARVPHGNSFTLHIAELP